MSGHENVEWVYTDTEAGVTFTEHSRDPTIPADFTADSCPGISSVPQSHHIVCVYILVGTHALNTPFL